MRKLCKHCIFTLLVFTLIVTGSSAIGWAQGQNSPNSKAAKLHQRIDFGNSYIMGQSIKSGAVYLLHRKQNEINSMLQYREDYRQEILEDFAIQDLKVSGPRANGQSSTVSQKSAPRP
ncbi:MAG: hypothetical protein KJP23_22195 [Deltaproteobacteria bacterium]|nr:hypothetical protein [Deltaproteobacteria bacterium]